MIMKIRLNESQLNGLIAESVKELLEGVSYDTLRSAAKKSLKGYAFDGKALQACDVLDEYLEPYKSDGSQGQRWSDELKKLRAFIERKSTQGYNIDKQFSDVLNSDE